MNTDNKKLGDAELEIMLAIWGSEAPVTSGYILNELKNSEKKMAAFHPDDLACKA